MSVIWKIIIFAIIALLSISSLGAYALIENYISYSLIEILAVMVYLTVGYLIYKNYGYFHAISAAFLIFLVAFAWDYFLLFQIDGLWQVIPDMPPKEEMLPVIYVIAFFFGIMLTVFVTSIGAGISRLINGTYVKPDSTGVLQPIKVPVINSRLMSFVCALLVVLIVGLSVMLFKQKSNNIDRLDNTSFVADYDLARKAYERGDYKYALELILPLANNGYANAQNSLGYLYLQGQGVQQDYTEAKKWFDKAAEQGSFKAQTSLGYLYEKGLGVPKDLIKAIKFYRNAAEQGYAKAQYNLGYAYRNGFNGSIDLIQAYAWLDIATKNGYEAAQESRGQLHIKLTAQEIKQARELVDELVDKFQFKMAGTEWN